MSNSIQARPAVATIIPKLMKLGFSQAEAYAFRDALIRSDKIGTNLGNLTTQAGVPSSDQIQSDGVATLRRYQQSGALSIIDNAGFEAGLVNGSIPGWLQGTAVSIALDAG